MLIDPTPLTTPSHEIASAGASASEPVLFAIWIGVGLFGLLIGGAIVTFAERRLRAVSPATTANRRPESSFPSAVDEIHDGTLASAV